MPSFTTPLAIFAVIAVITFYLAGSDVESSISPQGCRMSYMSPSYVSQTGFNASWTPLARRYSLWLYREVGWDMEKPIGLPVLFIPGNAGSSHQIRSIASSASRQYYTSPGHASPDFWSAGIKPLDFYAVEFNEDLSAFHGATLQSQIEYTSGAVDYILSLYPSTSSLVILGHSMGGIVATALLPSPNISAIITMSTPHTIPPARFDSRIDDIYAKIRQTLQEDPTPIVSLCGGATDLMIPSESCILSPAKNRHYRKTVFTSALEGAWTGVGHQVMVWCHQVRWRVARAVLELSSQNNANARQAVLQKWLRDGHELPFGGIDSQDLNLSHDDPYETLPPGLQLVRRPVGKQFYLVPSPQEKPSGKSPLSLTVLVGHGSILPVSPPDRNSLQVSVYSCSRDDGGFPRCRSLKPSVLKLIPQAVPGEPFPSPRINSDPNSGGFDESEGVVLYEAIITQSQNEWIGIKADGGEGDGWVVAGFNQQTITSVIPTTSLLFGKAFVDIVANGAMRLDIDFPNLFFNSLIVYRLLPKFVEADTCFESILPPILLHKSHSVESHYYPLIITDDRRILLHTHHPAPYQTISTEDGRGLNLTMYSSGISGCINQLKGLEMSIAWFATLGRWTSRYITTLVAWATGASALVLYLCLDMYDRDAHMPSVIQSLRRYEFILLRFILPASFFASFLPWPKEYYIGFRNPGMFSVLAPLFSIIASGLLVVSWWILRLSLWVTRPLGRFFATRRHEGASVSKTTIISICAIFVFVALFIPWQVAYLGCWMYQFFTCASGSQSEDYPRTPENISLNSRDRQDEDTHSPDGRSLECTVGWKNIRQDNHRLNLHILLLMTWLLPLVAPVLVVWVRTMVTAGLTTPFDGEFVFFDVFPFLILVDFASWTSTPIFPSSSFERIIPLRWVLIIATVTSFLVGGTQPYKIFDIAAFTIGLLVCIRIGPRYWGSTSWPTIGL